MKKTKKDSLFNIYDKGTKVFSPSGLRLMIPP